MKSLVLGLLIVGLSLGTLPAQAADKNVTLRLSTVVSAPHPWLDAADAMAAKLKERSGGTINLKIFPAAQLGTDQSTFDEMSMGTIDMVIGGVTAVTSRIPEFAVLNLPYFFENYDHFNKVLDPKGQALQTFKKIVADRKLGVQLLALGGGGARVFSNNQRPVTKPEELKGLKMRVPNNPDDARIWSSVGALVTAMPFSEIYSALQTGVIQGFESTISSYTGSKFYEVAKYLCNTQHLLMISHLLVSDTALKKLSPAQRQILEEVVVETGPMFTQKGIEYDARFLQQLVKDNGVTLVEVDKQAFINAFQPLQDELAARSKTTELLKMLRAEGKK